MNTFILIHVMISLIAILSGVVVTIGLLLGKRLDRWTLLFLATTAATSVTGFFFFPFDGITPAQGFGVLTMALLALAIYGRYVLHLAGVWRKVFVVTALACLYLNVFVGIVQAFQKITFLKNMAPSQTAPPFVISQTIALLLFISAGLLVVKRTAKVGS